MAAFTYPRSEPGSGGHMDLVERLNSHTEALRLGAAAVFFADEPFDVDRLCAFAHGVVLPD